MEAGSSSLRLCNTHQVAWAPTRHSTLESTRFVPGEYRAGTQPVRSRYSRGYSAVGICCVPLGRGRESGAYSRECCAPCYVRSQDRLIEEIQNHLYLRLQTEQTAVDLTNAAATSADMKDDDDTRYCLWVTVLS